MKPIYVAFFLSFICAISNAEIQLTLSNETSNIGDGKATVVNASDYTQIHWTNKQSSGGHEAFGLKEGVEYEVQCTRIDGSQEVLQFQIATQSAQESMNALFIPVVDAFGKILFFDPFATFNLYDNRVYNSQGEILTHPNGEPIRTEVWLVVLLLIGSAIYFTFYFRFIQVRAFRHAWKVTFGQFTKKSEPGEVTPFQALSAALSGTLGLGNISLVAVAIAVGGPGATFWIIVAGLVGMSTKFVECTLGVKYRKIDETGEVSGGPMYYLSKGLTKRGWQRTGKFLAITFAIMCVGGTLGGGNMVQANQAFDMIKTVLPGSNAYALWIGIAFALAVGAVIVGGIKSIANVTDKLIPALVVIYTGFALTIIGMNIQFLDEACGLIWSGAFSPDGMKGGFLGVMMLGFRRAAFSNEAGIGSASIAHSTSKTSHPVSEGMVSLLEPFIDTVVVCTMTALVLVFTGFATDTQGLNGSALTAAAFRSVFPWSDWIMLVCIVLFAFATMISWSYYGMKSWAFLFGEKWWIKQSFNFLFLFCTVLGTVSSFGAVVDFSDMMILGMAFPNLIGLWILKDEVMRDLKVYWKEVKGK
ncbi:MAG: alanine:cation symporter family protein [Bacteroidetes bacterium]|nr:alanine:cation symporter family protein [Bacteroidota bacterium]